jgi:diguanylate cyclase (GGDEF)-like protein
VSLSSETTDWLVLLEAADKREGSTIDPSSFARLVSSWAAPVPTTLYSPSRYALQIAVRATDALSALSIAISLWKECLRRSQLPEWPLVRAEIMTPEELEQELQAADWNIHREDTLEQPPPRAGDVAADDLLRRALHDSVTGLPGREIFLDDARRALAARTSASPLLALLIVQLEAFDSVNRAARSSMPDDTLVETARRLTEVVRCRDTVARVGPGEFALLVEVQTGQDADCLARRIVDLLRCPPSGGDRPLAVRASVGVALSSSTDDADQLIHAAEWRSQSPQGRAAPATELSRPNPDSS